MNKQAVAKELVGLAKSLVADDWTSEVTVLEKAIGKAIAQNASKVISVTAYAGQGTDNAECELWSGELVKAVKDELKRRGWEIDDLTPGRLTFGLRRIKG